MYVGNVFSPQHLMAAMKKWQEAGLELPIMM